MIFISLFICAQVLAGDCQSVLRKVYQTNEVLGKASMLRDRSRQAWQKGMDDMPIPEVHDEVKWLAKKLEKKLQYYQVLFPDHPVTQITSGHLDHDKLYVGNPDTLTYKTYYQLSLKSVLLFSGEKPLEPGKDITATADMDMLYKYLSGENNYYFNRLQFVENSFPYIYFHINHKPFNEETFNQLAGQGIFLAELTDKRAFGDTFLRDPASFFAHDICHVEFLFTSKGMWGDFFEFSDKDKSLRLFEGMTYEDVVAYEKSNKQLISGIYEALDRQNSTILRHAVNAIIFDLTHELGYPESFHRNSLVRALDYQLEKAEQGRHPLVFTTVDMHVGSRQLQPIGLTHREQRVLEQLKLKESHRPSKQSRETSAKEITFALKWLKRYLLSL